MQGAAIAISAIALCACVHSAVAGCPFYRTGAALPPSHPPITAGNTQLLPLAGTHGVLGEPGVHEAGAAPPAPQWEGEQPHATNKSDPLVNLNFQFQSIYSASGAAMRPGTYIIQEGDYLVLFRSNGERIVENVTPDVYHDNKMISHIPFAVFLIVYPDVWQADLAKDRSTQKALSAATLASLSSYNDSLIATIGDSETFGRFTPASRARQTAIVQTVKDFLAAVMATKTCSVDQLFTMTRNATPNILVNVQEAGSAQVDTAHQTVMKWKGMLSAEEWDDMWVIVVTSHMAHRNNLFAQYFSRLLNVSIIESQKMISLQSVGDEATALTLLDTHLTDYPTGTAFFNETYRMHEDLLADAAKVAVDNLFGPPTPVGDDDPF